MKRDLKFTACTIGILLIFIISGCKKEEDPVELPKVVTFLISDISMAGATCGGEVKSDGGAPVTARGVCWGSNPSPAADKNKTSDGSGTGTFTSIIEGLAPNTFVYVRAYATNSAGTAYGEDMLLKTYTGTVADIDGNVYNTVTIMGMELMASNLKVTKYNDGTPIPEVTGNNDWSALSTPAYCWYENDYSTYGSVYGALYNWFAAAEEKLCPAGWRVPDQMNFLALEGFVSEAGDLKAVGTEHWEEPNTGATNSTGFTAYGSGRRDYNSGTFSDLWVRSNWWSRTEDAAWSAWQLGVNYSSQGVINGAVNKKNGYSVRCMKI